MNNLLLSGGWDPGTSSWHERFLEMATPVSTWSKDPSTKVGAVIVDRQRRVVSVGYNGCPRGVVDEGMDDRGEKLRGEKLRCTIHAEKNALLFASGPVTGCTGYTTFPPCANCMAYLMQTGIRQVVCRPASPGATERWAEDFASAARMREQAEIWYTELL